MSTDLRIMNDGIFYLRSDENEEYIRVVTNILPKSTISINDWYSKRQLGYAQIGDGIPPVSIPINDLSGVIEDQNLPSITASACWTGLLNREEGQFSFVGNEENDITDPQYYVKRTKTMMGNYFMGQVSERIIMTDTHILFTKLKYLNSYEYIGPKGNPDLNYLTYALYQSIFSDGLSTNNNILSDTSEYKETIEATQIAKDLLLSTDKAQFARNFDADNSVTGKVVKLASESFIDDTFSSYSFLAKLYNEFIGANTFTDQFYFKDKTIPLISYYMPPTIRTTDYMANRYIVQRDPGVNNTNILPIHAITQVKKWDIATNSIIEVPSDDVYSETISNIKNRILTRQDNYLSREILTEWDNSIWWRGYSQQDPEYIYDGIRPTRTRTRRLTICHPIENDIIGGWSFRLCTFAHTNNPIQKSKLEDILKGNLTYKVEVTPIERKEVIEDINVPFTIQKQNYTSIIREPQTIITIQNPTEIIDDSTDFIGNLLSEEISKTLITEEGTETSEETITIYDMIMSKFETPIKNINQTKTNVLNPAILKSIRAFKRLMQSSSIDYDIYTIIGLLNIYIIELDYTMLVEVILTKNEDIININDNLPNTIYKTIPALSRYSINSTIPDLYLLNIDGDTLQIGNIIEEGDMIPGGIENYTVRMEVNGIDGISGEEKNYPIGLSPNMEDQTIIIYNPNSTNPITDTVSIGGKDYTPNINPSPDIFSDNIYTELIFEDQVQDKTVNISSEPVQIVVSNTTTERYYQREKVGDTIQKEFNTIQDIVNFLQEYSSDIVTSEETIPSIIQQTNPRFILIKDTQDPTGDGNFVEEYEVSIKTYRGGLFTRNLPYVDPSCAYNNIVSEYTYFHYIDHFSKVENRSRVIEGPCHKITELYEDVVYGEPDLTRYNRCVSYNARFFFNNIGGTFEKYTSSSNDTNYQNERWLLKTITVDGRPIQLPFSSIEDYIRTLNTVEGNRRELELGKYAVYEYTDEGSILLSEPENVEAIVEILSSTTGLSITEEGIKDWAIGQTFRLTDTSGDQRRFRIDVNNFGSADTPRDPSFNFQQHDIYQPPAFMEVYNERDPLTGSPLTAGRGYIDVGLSGLYQTNVNVDYSVYCNSAPQDTVTTVDYKDQEKELVSTMSEYADSGKITAKSIGVIVRAINGNQYRDIYTGELNEAVIQEHIANASILQEEEIYIINYIEYGLEVFFVVELYPGIEKKLVLDEYAHETADSRFPTYFRKDNRTKKRRLAETMIVNLREALDSLSRYFVPNNGTYFAVSRNIDDIANRWVPTQKAMRRAIYKDEAFYTDQLLGDVQLSNDDPIESSVIDMSTTLESQIAEASMKWASISGSVGDSSDNDLLVSVTGDFEYYVKTSLIPSLRDFQRTIEGWLLQIGVTETNEGTIEERIMTQEITHPIWLRNFTHIQANLPPTVKVGLKTYQYDLERYSLNWNKICTALTWWHGFKTHINLSKLTDYYIRWVEQNQPAVKQLLDELRLASGGEQELRRFTMEIIEQEILNKNVQSSKISVRRNTDGVNTVSNAWRVDENGQIQYVPPQEASYDNRSPRILDVHCVDALDPVTSKMKEDLRGAFLIDPTLTRSVDSEEIETTDPNAFYIRGYDVNRVI